MKVSEKKVSDEIFRKECPMKVSGKCVRQQYSKEVMGNGKSLMATVAHFGAALHREKTIGKGRRR